MVKIADNELGRVGGIARFGWDDGYLCGPPNDVYPILDTFSTSVQEHCGLELQRSKTEVYGMDEAISVSSLGDLVRAGITVDGSWEPGFLCYGVPIGSDKYVTHMLGAKMDEIEEQAEQVLNVLIEESKHFGQFFGHLSVISRTTG